MRALTATFLTLALLVTALSHRATTTAALLAQARCQPLRIYDRHDHLLRAIPGPCAPFGRDGWTPIATIPPLLQTILVTSEDHNFPTHPGIDPLAVARATLTNLRGGRVISGASTLTMQLASIIEPAPRRRWSTKLAQAWSALALERHLSKSEILEAYVNLAYYGAGAYGISAAARTYFGKSVAALSDAEVSLLAVLPHAPARYDLRRGFAAATQRRDGILRTLVVHGELEAARERTILATPVTLSAPASAPESAAHFVDYVLRELTPELRSEGGALHTTLDLGLQSTLERFVAEHVASLESMHVDQAGLVVLDTDSGAIRAMVGSRDYRHSQINITTRRRQLGSLLKPFVYGLALEAGATPSSLAFDAGDVTPDYRARDWVGREAGPLTYREALAGSYNLAAIHTLDRVGVAALHARLRRAGVAQLSARPDRYGVQLALGSARVRLLDVASGYGAFVRGGFVRPAHAIETFERAGGEVWRPQREPERSVFSAAVSWQVMDMLSDPSARHLRFGRGLPFESQGPALVAAKTGTASGLSDVSAVVATSEYVVAAWAGRFDGAATHGTSGMWGAAPLAERALVAALSGAAPTLPRRPAEVAWVNSEPRPTDLPMELEAWAERARASAARTSHHEH